MSNFCANGKVPVLGNLQGALPTFWAFHDIKIDTTPIATGNRASYRISATRKSTTTGVCIITPTTSIALQSRPQIDIPVQTMIHQCYFRGWTVYCSAPEVALMYHGLNGDINLWTTLEGNGGCRCNYTDSSRGALPRCRYSVTCSVSCCYWSSVYFYIMKCSKSRQCTLQIAQNRHFSIGTEIAHIYM